MSARFYTDYLDEHVGSYDARVVHVLLERQYEISKRILQRITDTTLPTTAITLERKNLLDASSRAALSAVNASPLPDIKGNNEDQQLLHTPSPVSAPSASTSVVLPSVKLPPVVLITEDVGPSELTRFAAQTHSRDLSSSSAPTTKRARVLTEDEEEV